MSRFSFLIFALTIMISQMGAQVIVPDFLVNDAAQNTQGVGRTAIAVAPNGNFAIAWQDFNEYGIPIPAMPRVAVQLFSANVVPIGPLNLFNGETRAGIIYLDDYLTGHIDLAFMPNNILLVAVQHEGLFDNLVTQVWSWETGIGAVSPTGQIIDLLTGTGVIFWLFPFDLVDNGNLRLAMSPTGNFWGTLNGPSYSTDFSAVLIQQFDSNLNYVGNYFTPHPNDPGPNANHVYPDIATNGNILLAVWQDGRQDPNYDVTAQFYGGGVAIGGNQAVNSGDPANTYNLWPSVAMNSAGNSVIVWVDSRLGSGEIFGQRFNAAGQPVGGNFQISAGGGAIPLFYRPEVAMRSDGSFMVVWTDSLSGISGIDALRARGRQFDANGNPTTAPILLPNQPVASGHPNIATNGVHYYCSWLDVRINNTTPNVYAKVLAEITDIEEPISAAGIPTTSQLFQNYPNPFNPVTAIGFQLPANGFVTLKIYNNLGEEVVTLVSQKLAAGKYKYEWDANGLASGVYLCRLQINEFVQVRKMLLVR
ncbi:MAG: hypothetical protein Kow0042_11680 [Calditrichia bacterium]